MEAAVQRDTKAWQLQAWASFGIAVFLCAVGLAWLLSREGVTAPIVGPRTQAQLDGALHAVELTLSAETLTRLDEIFPAPGPNGSKPAPEAYAW